MKLETTTSPMPETTISTTSSLCPLGNGYGIGEEIVNGLNCTCMHVCTRFNDYPERCETYCQGKLFIIDTVFITTVKDV